MLAQIRSQESPPPQPTFTVSPYIWQDIGIIGLVVVSLAIALGKWLPDHLNQRWEVRKKEIEQAIARQEKAMQAEYQRDEREAKLLADSFSTLLAKDLARSHELLENLAVTQLNIARSLEIQEESCNAIAAGFKSSTANQEKQIELLGEICTLLQNTKP